MPYSYADKVYKHAFSPFPSSDGDIVFNRNTRAEIERNLITFAASRSGKGACHILPTLDHWSHSALVIDPKGEAAEHGAATREAMGQSVHVIDPFNSSNVPDRFRASINILDEINPNDPNAFRQINAIADGLIMRHSAEAGHWDGGALEVVAGFLALAVAKQNSGASLPAMRQLLTEPDPEKFAELIDEMSVTDSCGRLAISGAGKLTKTGTESGHFLSGAVSNTKWLDDPFMQAALSDSTFKLSDLKRKPMTVYLVLPMDALGDYGRFLRLFVRIALYHMQQKLPDGSLKGERCLFLLDEFFSLGNITEIQKAAGGLPGFGVHLWPFLQDWNQLVDLYGRDGGRTFVSNADYSLFYGINDAETADVACNAVGKITEADLQVTPPPKPHTEVPERRFDDSTLWGRITGRETYEYDQYRINNGVPRPPRWWEGAYTEKQQNEFALQQRDYEVKRANHEADYNDAMNQYAYAKQAVGHLRVTPQDVMQMTARSDTRKIAEKAIIVRSGDAFLIDMHPHFEAAVTPFASNDTGTVKQSITPNITAFMPELFGADINDVGTSKPIITDEQSNYFKLTKFISEQQNNGRGFTLADQRLQEYRHGKAQGWLEAPHQPFEGAIASIPNERHRVKKSTPYTGASIGSQPKYKDDKAVSEVGLTEWLFRR